MEDMVRKLGGASDVPRMMSSPEPEPVDADDPIEEEEEESEGDDEVRQHTEYTKMSCHVIHIL